MKAKPAPSVVCEFDRKHRRMLWFVNGAAFCTDLEKGACPMCLTVAVCALPKPLSDAQPDGTTHVCHPVAGGCNHGFVDERGKV